MRRRDFIRVLGGATIALPLGARASPAKPIVGVLSLNSSPPMASYTAWFVRGLNEAGFAEGQNVVIEYRWAEGDYDRLAPLASELAGDHVAVIFASGGAASLRAAMAATSTIPIIFSLAGDPVKLGPVDKRDSQISVSMIQDCLSRGGRIGARRSEQCRMGDNLTFATA
jgi:putative tryptophan/tyrosine transport system substrate-binding protein